MPVAVLNNGTFNRGGSPLTSRPNDGSGFWPDFSNTGYLHSQDPPSDTSIPCTHGYAGVYDYADGMAPTSVLFVDGTDGQSFNRYHFQGKTQLGHGAGDNFVMNGCVFDGTFPNDNMVQTYLNTLVVFNLCTFKPAGISSPPGNNGSQSSATGPSNLGTPFNSSYESIASNANGSQAGTCVYQVNACDIWGNGGFQTTSAGTSGLQGHFSACYIHDLADPWAVTYLEAFPGQSGFYHQDGVGPDSGSTPGLAWFNVTGNTIASMGSANGVAFQGDSNYSNITVTGNYISGWTEAVAVGAALPDTNANITFEGNIFSGEVANVGNSNYAGAVSGGGPYVGNGACSPYNNLSAFPAAAGSSWRRNFYQVFGGDPDYPTSLNGLYWWPTDNSGHAADYTG